MKYVGVRNECKALAQLQQSSKDCGASQLPLTDVSALKPHYAIPSCKEEKFQKKY